MASKFENRGHSKSVINRGLSIASKVSRGKLLAEKSTKKDKNIRHYRGGRVNNPNPTFSTSYSLEYDKVRKIVNKYLPVLSHDLIYSQILTKGIRTVSRKAPSLGNLLSLFSSRNNTTNWLSFRGTFRCGGRNCAYCPFIKYGDTIISSSTGKSHKIHSLANCNIAIAISYML